MLFVVKVITSFLIAAFLTVVAEKRSLNISGVLSSFPNVSLIIMLFIALEQGIGFSTEASVYAVYGVALNMLLASSIMALATVLNNKRAVLFGSALVYGGCAWLTAKWFPAELVTAGIVFVSLWILLIFLWRGVREVPVSGLTSSKRATFLMQFLWISFIVTVTTALAPHLGTTFSGILGAFPGVTTAVGGALFIRHGKAQTLCFFRAAIFGWLPCAAYFFSVTLSYQHFGIVLGTLVSSAIAVIATLPALKLKRILSKRPSPATPV